MLPGKPDKQHAKCLFTHGQLTRKLDPARPPSSRIPFSTVLSSPWYHTIDLCTTEETWRTIQSRILHASRELEYYKVYMPPLAILEGNFFNVYVKTGNIEMLSEGSPSTDCIFSLRQGVLRMELPRDIYERTGLVGQVIADGGRKHVKNRFLVEINLRQPSMVRGKKGFDRIVWALTNVLNHSLTWLFCDVDAQPSKPDPDSTEKAPIAAHHPFLRKVEPIVTVRQSVSTPSLTAMPAGVDTALAQEDAMDLLEWLGMISLDSPRLLHDREQLDPYLSRYQVPRSDTVTPQNLVHVRWTGFLRAEWARAVLLDALASTPFASWISLSAATFRQSVVENRDGFTLLKCAGTEASSVEEPLPDFYVWEMIACNDDR